MGEKAYFFSVNDAPAFQAHRHPEIEISYCIEGYYDVICEKKRYSLFPGDLIVVGAMASHEIPPNNKNCKCITIELGYALLGSFFENFKARNSICRLYKKDDFTESAQYRELVSILEETADISVSDTSFQELLIKGNLYKVSALLLQMLYSSHPTSFQDKKMTDVNKIENALENIYKHYSEPLSVETVSAMCGYSKSNFCRIFKNITGDTFHNTLNRHRIETSCILLRETDYTIERIALETGFVDAKTFCRVFKKYMGNSAGEYRKSSHWD